MGFTGGACGKEPTFKAGDMRRGFDPWVREDVLEKAMAPHSTVLAHGQRSLVSYSAWGHKRLRHG